MSKGLILPFQCYVLLDLGSLASRSSADKWDEKNAERQRKFSDGRGYHNPATVDVAALTKDPSDYIDGKDQW
jgi:hypothetical protein